MKKAARVCSVFVKHAGAGAIDPAAIYERLMSDPIGKAPTILENAKQVGIKGYPKFVTNPLISKVEGDVSEYAKKLPTFSPEKIQNFIKQNPGIFKGVKSFGLNAAPVA